MPQSKDAAPAETKFRFYVVQDERFVDLNLYQFGWEKCAPMHQFGPAIRNHFLFHYILSGRGWIDNTKEGFQLEAGQGFLICPNQIYTYCADPGDPWTYTWIEFDGLRARESMTLAGLSEKQPVYTPSAAHTDNSLQRYMMQMVDHGQASPLYLVGQGMIILDEIVQTSRTKITTGNKRIRDFYMKEAAGFIDANFQRDISIEEIAAACGLNHSYFGRLFKETYGESPQQFLIHYRMAKAAELLRGSRISIAEVGKSVGYENQLRFSRAFKSVFGISPSAYRSKHYLNPE